MVLEEQFKFKFLGPDQNYEAEHQNYNSISVDWNQKK